MEDQHAIVYKNLTDRINNITKNIQRLNWDLEQRIYQESSFLNAQDNYTELNQLVNNKTMLDLLSRKYKFLLYQDQTIYKRIVNKGKENLEYELQKSVDFLLKVIEKLDNNTILLLCSDHGHSESGGYGGDESLVKGLKFYFFIKN